MTPSIIPTKLEDSLKKIPLHKQKLRQSIKKFRQDLPLSTALSQSRLIAKKVLALPQLKAAQTVFCYVARAKEVATRDLIQTLLEQNKQVFVPKVINQGQMLPVPLKSLTELKPGKFNILEPSLSLAAIQALGESITVKPSFIDVNIMPVVAVDRQGRRLGLGGGYYDRFVAQVKPKFNLALAFSGQLVDLVPVAPNDKLVDMIVTEQAVININ